MSLMIRCITILAIFAALACAGCESDQQKKQREAEMYRTTPLEFDPTEDYELPQWWSNGQQMLRLNADASYALYAGSNRYAKPLERGRWSQQSYAILWLEPYSSRQAEATRVGISKIDGKLALRIRRYEPMLGIDAPPKSIEDRLVGQWSGAMGTLSLRSDLRYSLAPGEAASDQEAFIAGHNGSWSLTPQGLQLRPDTPSIKPMTLKVRLAKDAAGLEGPGGALTRDITP